MNKKLLLTQQLNAKIKAFAPAEYISSPPPTGWIKAIRTALGMSLAQLGKRLRITRQSVLEIERREKEGSITIKSLKEIATALDMQLVYGFVPNDGSLDALIEKKAKELAYKIVLRSSNTMILEDQGNSEERIDQAIKERTAIIKNELPKMLWD